MRQPIRVHIARISGAATTFALLAMGCAERNAQVRDYVVTPELAAGPFCAEAHPVVLDVRPIEQYTASHVPGATWVDASEWTKLSRSADSGFRDTQGWARRIGQLGIANDDLVFVYDGGEMTEAARLWYILQLFGAWHSDVVDGGWPALQAAFPKDGLISGPPAPPITKQFDVWTRTGRSGVVNADKSAVRQNLSSKIAQVWDARTMAEYDGENARNNPRSGHIPGAVNLSHTELLDKNGRLKSAAELRQLLAAAGFQPGRPIITHCQSGGRASLAALAALRAGYGPISNYYMSFGEWAADETCPLVEPEPTASQPTQR